MTRPAKLPLTQRRWVPLPGTRYEVLLRGKYHDLTDGRAWLVRNGADGQPGGWDLRPYWGLVFVRVRSARQVLNGR